MKCQYSLCSNEVEIVPGHRQRKYCSDSCKQNAYRDRLEEAARQAEELARQERERQAKASLRKEFGDLLPDTIELLYQLRQSGHYSLVQTIGSAIVAEKEQAIRDQAEERTRLIEQLMLLGEEYGYRDIMSFDSIWAKPGIEAWSDFVQHANIRQLQLAISTVQNIMQRERTRADRLNRLNKQS